MRSKISVLVVEDDELYRAIFGRWLLECGVDIVELCSTAEQGMHLILNLKPTIVFLGNNLPKLNGNEVANVYKESSVDSIIILISANFTMSDLVHGVNNSVDHFIDKSKVNRLSLDVILLAAEESLKTQSSIGGILSGWEKNLSKNQDKTISIIEDNQVSAYKLKWLIASSPGKHVINTYNSAKSFYESTLEVKPDFVFLDYYLPDTNGMEVLKYIKGNLPKAKTVVISGQQKAKTVFELNKLGLDGYIEKDENLEDNLKKMLEKLGIE